MKKIFLHIGIGKTATSAIQKVCYESISDDSNTKYFPFGLIGDVHNSLSDFHPNFKEDIFDEAICQFKNLDSSYNYLISSEFLAYASKDLINTLIKAIINAGFQPEVILVIRSFSDLLLSSYLQALKSGFGLHKGESIIDYAERVQKDLNYLDLLDKWGQCTAKIIDFDLNKKNIINVFLNELEINVKSNIELSRGVNLSLMCEFIPLIRQFDSRTPEASSEDRKEFIQRLLDFSKDYYYLSDNRFHKQCIEKISDEMERLQYPKLKQKYNFI